jgi:hypothetical protein
VQLWIRCCLATSSIKDDISLCRVWECCSLGTHSWLTTDSNLQLTFHVGPCCMASVQTTRKTPFPTVPLFVCVDRLLQKRVYCTICLATAASSSTIPDFSPHVTTQETTGHLTWQYAHHFSPRSWVKTVLRSSGKHDTSWTTASMHKTRADFKIQHVYEYFLHKFKSVYSL